MAVFLALAVLGTVFGSAEDELATAGSERPSATERPTATPTPERTAEPTERETLQPTVNTDQRELQAFSTHVVGFTETFVDDLYGIMADAEALDIEALSQSSVAMWVNLGEEQSWVADHVPAACYVAMYDAYSDMIDTYYEAMDLISDGAIYYDVYLIEQGANLMLVGNEQIVHTTALAQQVSCS